MLVTQSMIDAILGSAVRLRAKARYSRFLRYARLTEQTQARVLRKLLAQNADSDFGKEHCFDRIRHYDDFRRRVPIRTYEGLRPYVERVMAGDTRSLLGSRQRVKMFAMTSGSTDVPKYVPVTNAFVNDYRSGWSAFGFKAMLDHPDAFLRPILQVTSPMSAFVTECGVPCGAVSGLLAAAQNSFVRRYYAVPPDVARIADPEARYYSIMRFAVPRDVGWIVTASPATTVKLARIADAHAEQLIRDVQDGTLTPPGEVSGDLRSALARHLPPDPASAHGLHRLAETHGRLLPRHYWRLAFLANWTGGTLAMHLRDFPQWFGDVPIRDIGLLATEGRVSVGLEDGTPSGLLDVGASFFEFVESTSESADPSSVRRSHELEVGGEYRVVMTTSAGFTRYDLGDCVRVRGHVGGAPLIEFLHRGSRVSSMTGEKLTEWQVTHAVERSCEALGLSLRSFVVAPVWNDPPYYRLHVDESVNRDRELASLVDRELCRVNMEYDSKRSSGRLGELSLFQLVPGTLMVLDGKRMAAQSASAEQFKHQYLLTAPGGDDDLIALRDADPDRTQNDKTGFRV